MKYNENLILSPDLLVSTENNCVNDLLLHLQKFIREVPVAHYDHSRRSEDPIFDRNSGFFRDDYSYLHEGSSHTGVELVKMIRLFVNYVNESHKPAGTDKKGNLKQVEIWDLFSLKNKNDDKYWDLSTLEKDNDNGNKNTYIDMIKGHVDDLDSVIIPLSLLLQGRSLYDQPKTWKSKELYTNPIRADKQDRGLDFMIPQDEKSLNLFFTFNGFRNKKAHWGVSPFNPPTDPEKAFRHYYDLHLRIVLCCMILFDRFYEELWEILVKDKDTIDIANLGGIPVEDSKKVVKNFYIRRLHRLSDAQMRSLFRGTGISDKKDLLSDLPEILLSRQDDKGRMIAGDCVEMLVDNQDSKRKIVIGDAGSGKTVMFLRMIQRNQPMLTPFYLELKDFNTADLTPRLERAIIGEDRLIITRYALKATIGRIHKLLKEGSAVFFIDSAESAPENLKHLAGFISRYPECHYIIGTQERTIPEEIKDMAFQRYDILQFNEGQTKDLMRLMSLHITGNDHTEKLYRDIRQISQEITHNPLTLTQLIYLYEKSAGSMKSNLSRPMLFWNLYDSIQDEEDRQMLKERQFMKQFFRNLEDVTELCRNVIAKYNADPGSDWASLILNFALVSSDLKQFFDLTEIIRLYDSQQERNSVIFRTLATMAILERDMHHGDAAPHISTENDRMTIQAESLPMPNPALNILAPAVRDLPFVGPDSGDIHNSGHAEGDFRTTYRLQPKYIIRQYLLSLLFFYKKFGADIKNSPEQINAMFTGIASSGDEELLKEVFAPYWLRQWLINKNDISETDNIKVYGGKNSQLRITLSQNNAAPHVFALLMLRQSVWLEAKRMKHTATLLEGTIVDVIVHRMNDDQREKFVERLRELSGLLNEDTLGYYRNLAIASMDSIYMLDQFDRNNREYLGDDIMKHLKGMGNYIPALSILLSRLSHLISVPEMKQYQDNSEAINSLMSHLISNGILKTPQLADRFWSMITDCQQVRKRDIRHYLDKIPLEDILPEIALKAYDKTVWEHLTNQHRLVKERLSEWVEPEYTKTCKDLYLPVNKVFSQHNHTQRNSVQYTFYSQPEDHLFIVATEWIDEMPEGKFCQIRNFDQWFFVEDVIVLGKESDLKHIAELTINLPDGAPRRRKGTIVLGEGKKMNYIHLFEHGTSPQVVVRIDNNDALIWLMEEGRSETLKKDREVLFNGIKAELVGADIRDIPENMRLVVLKPVRNSGYSKIPERIDSIPMKGRLSFYPSKDKSQLSDGLLLKSPPEEYRAGKRTLKDGIYLGVDLGLHYILSETELNQGNHLIWKNNPMTAEILSCYTFSNEDEIKKLRVPSAIRSFLDETLMSGKHKFNRTELHISIVMIHKQDKNLSVNELHAPGTQMGEADITFYHPVTVPKRKAWEHVEHKIVVDSVSGERKAIDGHILICVPKTTYPEKAKFYSTPEYPERMPVRWHTLQGEGNRYDHRMFIIVDQQVVGLIKKETSVQFFEKADSGKALSIRFGRLTDMVDIVNHTNYHSSMTPLLIREWMKEGYVGTFRYQFSKNKHYLARLVQECIHHHIPLIPEWALRLYYVKEVKDNGKVDLYAPPAKFSTREDLNHVTPPQFKGKLPEGLKKGDMVMLEKNRLTVLDEACIREISRYESWGFRRGTVSYVNNKGKNLMRIESSGLRVWFAPPENITSKHKNREVIYFPVIIDNIPMAKYVQLL